MPRSGRRCEGGLYHSNMHAKFFRSRFAAHPRRSLAFVLAVALAFGPAPRLSAAEPPLKSALPSLGDAASDDLSPITEKKLGDEIMRQAREAGDILEDPEASEYLNQFGANLVAHVPPGEGSQYFEFFLVSDPAINAFALPGGYIGINSGLLIATQTESELASVLSHEMGHVTQRHVARSITRQKQTSLVALAATLLGIIAASRATSVNAGQAAIAAGQGYAIQDQINFSREAEREADRVGFQVLQASGFDATAMATFFGRMQQATRIYDTGAPAWLQSHPLTTERIADIQNRIREAPYKQRLDSLDFQLVRARLRVLQDVSVQGMRDTRLAFEDQLKNGNYASRAAVRYGLAVVLLRQRDHAGAQRELDAIGKLVTQRDAILENLAIDVKQASGDAAGAVELANSARARFPQSRMLAANYAEALQQAGRHAAAIDFLRDRIALYRSDPVPYELLARSYAAKGDTMLSHRMLGESYFLRGSVPAALEQMQIARKNAGPSADFYELSQLDARIRELQAQMIEIRKAEREGSRRTPSP